MDSTKKSTQPEPGAQLRQAREGRKLSIDDVAEALRLSPRIIAALEEDAYDRLPGPTYVRGYLRSYAQFLDLSAQRLIDAYNHTPEAAQRADMTAPAPVRQATSSDAMVRLGTVLVAAVVLGLATLWWSGHDTSLLRTRALGPAVAPSEDSDSERAATERDILPDPHPESEIESAPSLATVADPSTAAEPVERQNGPVPVTAPAPSASAGAEPAPRAPPAQPNVPTSRLVLYMHEDSWADVRDAQQQRLLYQTIPAGRVVTVEGVAPISVFLGNVEGVTVEFNGKEYDPTRHRRGEVARFTLGAPRG